ncbi:hypothetical protein ACW5BZ_02345 [Pediococcus pentosaceus]
MEQLTAFLKKYKKWVITIAILIVAGFGAKTTYEYHQNNIISQMDVKFSGYNGEGTAEIKKKDKFLNDTALRIFKLNGVRTDIAKKIISSPSNFNYGSLSTSDQQKITQAFSELNSLKVKLSKSEHLKNGDKIDVYVKNNDPEHLPFRDGKKIITVKGLKKAKTVSTQKIFDKLKIKAVGTDGKGSLSITGKNITTSSVFDGIEIAVKNNGSLSNGDSVKIKLPSSVFKDPNGKKVYAGSHTLNYKVTGLVDKSISNVSDVESAVSDMIDDYNDGNDDYTPNFVSLYLTHDEDYYIGGEDDTSSEHVTIDDEDDVKDDNTFTITAIYNMKSNDADLNDETVEAIIHDIKLKNNKLNINSIDLSKSGEVTSVDNTKTIEHNLASDGLKLK